MITDSFIHVFWISTELLQLHIPKPYAAEAHFFSTVHRLGSSACCAALVNGKENQFFHNREKANGLP